ncbi:MAG: hypothetical protein ACPGNV_18115 [Mangrovicoccus sp.]
MRAPLDMIGVAPDDDAVDASPERWSAANNVFARSGRMQRSAGDLLVIDTAGKAPRVMVQATFGGLAYLVYACDAGIFAHNGDHEFDISPADWTAPGASAVWTATTLHGAPVINVSDRDPVYWAGDTLTACAALPDWPASGRCLAIRAHKTFLFAVGMISEGPGVVRISDSAEPGTMPAAWGPAAENLADVRDLGGVVLDASPLGDELLIYSETEIHGASFVGGTYIWSMRSVHTGAGLANTGALAVSSGGTHVFVASDGDILECAGQAPQSLIDGRALDDFRATRAGDALVFSAPQIRSVVVAYDSGSGALDRSLVLEDRTGHIGYRAGGFACVTVAEPLSQSSGGAWSDAVTSWAEAVGGWGGSFGPRPGQVALVGSAAGVSVLEGGADDAVSATLSRSPVDLTGGARAQVRALEPVVLGDAGTVLQFRVSTAEFQGGPVSLTRAVHFVIGRDRVVHVLTSGRYVGVEVSSNGAGHWRLSKIAIDWEGAGQW